MDTYRGLYSRLSGHNPDQDLDDELDSLLSLPNVNPNQPREWLHIDEQGKTSYTLVSAVHSPHKVPSTVICATKLSGTLLKSTLQVQANCAAERECQAACSVTLSHAVQVDKHAIVAELGIRYRDLRILDPLVSRLNHFCLLLRLLCTLP